MKVRIKSADPAVGCKLFGLNLADHFIELDLDDAQLAVVDEAVKAGKVTAEVVGDPKPEPARRALDPVSSAPIPLPPAQDD